MRCCSLHFVLGSLACLLCALQTVTAGEDHKRTLELVYKGYSLVDYRAAATDYSYRIVPPVCFSLTSNIDHKPPLDVKNPAGRPKQGPRKKARIASNGEHNTSSRTYAIYNADARRSGGGGATAEGGGGSAGGGAAGVMDLSQGVMDLSQGPSQGEQA